SRGFPFLTSQPDARGVTTPARSAARLRLASFQRLAQAAGAPAYNLARLFCALWMPSVSLQEGSMRRVIVLVMLLAAGSIAVAAFQQPAAGGAQAAAPKVVEVEKLKDNFWVLKG